MVISFFFISLSLEKECLSFFPYFLGWGFVRGNMFIRGSLRFAAGGHQDSAPRHVGGHVLNKYSCVENPGLKTARQSNAYRRPIGSLHDRVTWPCQSKNGRSTKQMLEMKKDVKNMKVAKLEAPNSEEWVLMAVWILGKFKGFVWKILLVSKTCSPVTFFHTNLLIF